MFRLNDAYRTNNGINKKKRVDRDYKFIKETNIEN